MTNHERRGGAFARRTDELLAAPKASITRGEYARLARLQSWACAHESPRVEIDHTPDKLRIRFETHEHEYRSYIEVFVCASLGILKHDAAQPAVTFELLQDGMRAYIDLRVPHTLDVASWLADSAAPRTTSVTCRANFVRNNAPSAAPAPPPTTRTSLSR